MKFYLASLYKAVVSATLGMFLIPRECLFFFFLSFFLMPGAIRQRCKQIWVLQTERPGLKCQLFQLLNCIILDMTEDISKTCFLHL